MKMLGKRWQVHFINETGQTMTYNDGARIALRMQPWKMVSGNLTYGTVITEDFTFETGEAIVDDGQENSTIYDNSSDLFWGINGTFEITHDLDTAEGECRLYLEYSDNDGNWPSSAAGFAIENLILLAVLPVHPNNPDESFSINFEF